MAKNTGSNTLDVLIIGANLQGLILAHHAHQQGQRVALLESQPMNPQLDEFGFLPASDSIIKGLELARQVSGLDLAWRVVELPPVTFSHSEKVPFVGFGEREVACREELHPFLASTRLELDAGLRDLKQTLLELVGPTRLSHQEVTELRLSGGKIQEVLTNGETLWRAEKVIFCPSPHTLLGLVDLNGLENRTRQRLAKSTAWTSIVWTTSHSPGTPRPGSEVCVLNPATHEYAPVLALSESGPSGGVTTWLSLVAPEHVDDHDFVSKSVGHLKRQAKKQFPEAFSQLTGERLVVHPDHFGHIQLKLTGGCLPEASNLFLASHLLSPWRGLAAQFDVAAQLAPYLTSENAKKNLQDLAPA